MNQYEGILRAEAAVLFIILFFFLYFIESKGTKSKIGERGKLFGVYSYPVLFYILLAAGGITYVAGEISKSALSASLVFVAVLGLCPLYLANTSKRLHQEQIFSDVTLYCQNMGMMLKQTHSVYSSMERVSRDLETELREDVKGLLKAFEGDQKTVRDTMKTMEKNYPYSCIRNLDAILLHMFYENAQVDDSLLVTYQEDVTALEQDVRKNKMKRRTLRISYIIITIGSILTYWAFLNSLRDSFGDVFDSVVYRGVNLAYLFATLFSFFAVDRYFNINTTKE